MSMPEPWLRGPIEGVHPLVMPVFFSFTMVREDLAKHTAGLTREQLWRKMDGASVGFHLKHIAGSVERITAYLMNEQLTEQQLQSVRDEIIPDADLEELLRRLSNSLAASEQRLRTIEPHSIYDSRAVGRKALPTTVIGLIVHLAEHTQRHLGQAISTAKIVRQSG